MDKYLYGQNVYKIESTHKVTSNMASCYSYGIIKGSYNLSPDEICELVLDPNVRKTYAFVEKKSEYFKFAIDIDFKNEQLINIIKEKEEDLINYIINIITKIINKY